jgi:hypothetical protein
MKPVHFLLNFRKVSNFTRSNRRKIAMLVMALLAGLGQFVRFMLFPDISFSFHLVSFLLSFVAVYFIWSFLDLVDKMLTVYIPLSKSIWKRILVQIAITTLFMMVLRYFMITYLEAYIPFKLNTVFRFTAYLVDVIVICLINLGYFTFHFFEEWKKTELHEKQLEKDFADMQFENLKNQLNPHFLFNSLTSLNSLIYENQELASQFLKQLSRVYRYLLEHKQSDLVSLQTEGVFIANYIALLKTRFNDALEIHLNLLDQDLEKKVVPVTLQVLLENAIKHNRLSPEQPLTIEIYTDGDYLIIANNKQLKLYVEASNKQGLTRLKQLYSYLSNREIMVYEDDVQFMIKVPLLA